MAKIPFPKHDRERFWSRVDKSGDCWIWTGARGGDRKKYGFFLPSGPVGRRHWYAHRFAYRVTHGPIPKGMFVCHRCNNGLCVNPDHLYLGTPGQNTRDAVRDDLFFRDGRPTGAKLKAEQVVEIRSLVGNGDMTRSQAATRYGVSTSAIGAIVRGASWRHVSEENAA